MINDISFLVICIGHACTLRCKDCGNFTPFVPHENKLYPVDKIIRDLQIVSKFSKIKNLQIQGGEPFLHPELSDILKYVIENDNIEKIQIASNGVGTIKCLDELKNPKVHVRLSDYQLVESDYPDILKKENIRYRIYKFASKTSMWYNTGDMNTPRESDDEVCEERFKSCSFNKCLTLENSKIGYCSRSIIAEKVQGFSAVKGDYLQVQDSANFGEELEHYIYSKHFMEACRYCLGSKGGFITPAVQL